MHCKIVNIAFQGILNDVFKKGYTQYRVFNAIYHMPE